jgi:glyoxylase-like metal-dependent hydrolase (beta-lactamase superfamily II)
LTGALYRRLAKFEIAESQTLTALIGALGYPMSDVHSVVLSHLHQDHIGGLSEVSAALLHVSRAEWHSKSRPRSELRGVMPDHIGLPGLRWKLVDFDARTRTAIGPFDSHVDLFDDGSLTLMSTPGHTPGSMSMLVRRPSRPPLALVGDLTYDAHLLSCGHVPGVRSRRQLAETTAQMNELSRQLGGLVVLAAHDPGAAGSLAAALAM